MIKDRASMAIARRNMGDSASAFWEQQDMAKAIALLIFILAFIPTGASAKDTRFWNLTANTITSLQLSPAGKNDWGPNQADNDRDRTVDHDERLKITDTAPGIYDVKFVDKSGRTCVVPNIEVKTGAIFTIEEKSLKDCAR
jgi:hypothetical protein